IHEIPHLARIEPLGPVEMLGLTKPPMQIVHRDAPVSSSGDGQSETGSRRLGGGPPSRWGRGDQPPRGPPLFLDPLSPTGTPDRAGSAKGRDHLQRASYATVAVRNVNATHLPAGPFRYDGIPRQGRGRPPQEEGGGDGDFRPEGWPTDGL